MILPRTHPGLLPSQNRPAPASDEPQVPRGRRRVHVAIEEDLGAGGARLRRVVVDDPTGTTPATKVGRAVLQVLDDLLRAHPEWPAPKVADGGVVTHGNPVAEWLYRSDALSEWRTELVPSAIALYPVQRQHEHLPSGAAHDETTTLVLRHSLDAAGIRTRAMVMSDAVGLAEARCASEPEPGLWVSLACGAAVPVLDARADLGSSAHVVLVDVDPQALAFAGQLAERAGLVRDQDFTVLQRDLVRSLVVHDDLITEIGEQRAAVVDALGIFEYFNDASAVRLLRNAYRLVRPGGSLVVGNMLADRPELHFNQRGAGWPGLHVRSVEQLAGLVQRAGLPLDRTTISIPQDGVYAVVDVVR